MGAGPSWGELPRWAKERKWQFKPTTQPRGFVLVDPARRPDGRIEWGPSHRDYLGIYELRVRGATHADPAQQAVLMPKVQAQPLLEDTKPSKKEPLTEVQWLQTLKQPTAHGLGRLEPLCSAAASELPWLHAWLASPVADALQSWIAPEKGVSGPPFVFAHHHGTLVLRVAMSHPDGEAIDRALDLFDQALREARRVSAAEVDDAPEPRLDPSLDPRLAKARRAGAAAAAARRSSL